MSSKPNEKEILAAKGEQLDLWVGEHITHLPNLGYWRRASAYNDTWERCNKNDVHMPDYDGVGGVGKAGLYYKHDTWTEPFALPRYSTDWNHMSQVIEAMKELGFSFALWDGPLISSVMITPLAAFRRGMHPPNRGTGGPRKGSFARADEVPEAVCKAALLAVLCDKEYLDAARMAENSQLPVAPIEAD